MKLNLIILNLRTFCLQLIVFTSVKTPQLMLSYQDNKLIVKQTQIIQTITLIIDKTASRNCKKGTTKSMQ